MHSMCYYGNKFHLDSNFTELHALVQASCSYALLDNTIAMTHLCKILQVVESWAGPGNEAIQLPDPYRIGVG